MARDLRSSDGGSVVVPRNKRRERSFAAAIREAQTLVRQSVGRDRSLTDELLRERKAEADRE